MKKTLIELFGNKVLEIVISVIVASNALMYFLLYILGMNDKNHTVYLSFSILWFMVYTIFRMYHSREREIEATGKISVTFTDKAISVSEVKPGTVIVEGNISGKESELELKKFKVVTAVIGSSNWEYWTDGYYHETGPGYANWAVLGQKIGESVELVRITIQ